MYCDQIESNIYAPALLNLLNTLQKRGKMLDKYPILSLFLKLFNKFNKTWALLLDRLFNTLHVFCR